MREERDDVLVTEQKQTPEDYMVLYKEYHFTVGEDDEKDLMVNQSQISDKSDHRKGVKYSVMTH